MADGPNLVPGRNEQVPSNGHPKITSFEDLESPDAAKNLVV
jgi:hypothetical protein